MSSRFEIGNRIKVLNPSPNVDGDYGPYSSLSEVKDPNVLPVALRTKGKTVGIEQQDGSIEEYWWKHGTGDNDLEKKHLSAEDIPSGTDTIFTNANTLGAAPSANGATNTTAIQQALDQKGLVVLVEPGVYDVEATLLVPSDTTWIIAPGISLRKTGNVSTHSQVIANKAAASTDPSVRDKNIRVYGNNVNLIANGRDSQSGQLQWGLRAQVNFYKMDDFEISGLSMYDNGTSLYTYHFIDCHNGDIKDIWAEGDKDGLNISVCSDIDIDGLTCKCYDDGMFIGGYGYTTAMPIFGETENITVRNYKHLPYPGSVGYGARLYVASWAEWQNGNSYILGDVVVSNGNIYHCMNGPQTAQVASVQPTHSSGVVTGADGIQWRFKQVGTFTEANARNIVFENITSTADKEFLNCNDVKNNFARNVYPGTFGNAEATNIVIDNIDWKPETSPFPTAMLLLQNNLTSLKLKNSNLVFSDENFLARLNTSNAALQSRLGKFVIEDCQIELSSDAKFIQTDSNAVYDGNELIIRDTDIKTANTSITSFMLFRETATISRVSLFNTDIHNLPNLVFANENARTSIRVSGGSFINPGFIVYSTNSGSLIEYSSFGTYYDEPSSALFRSLGSGVIKASGYGNRGDVPFDKIGVGSSVDYKAFDLPKGVFDTTPYNDMRTFGASPSASGATNYAAMQAALNQKGVVILGEQGTYDLDDTLLISSDTTWLISPGVTLRKAGIVGSHTHIIANKAAESTNRSVRDKDIKIIGNGVVLEANGRDSQAGQLQWGLRAQVNFYKMDHFDITGLSMYDNGTSLYTYHFIDCNDGFIGDIWAEGDKDGLNISVCRDITIDGLDTKCKDDGMFIGGYGYTTAMPIFGDTENITIRNYNHRHYSGGAGYGARLYPASWADWVNGNTYILGDVVVSNGKIYHCMNSPQTPQTASVAPSHSSGVVTGADGIEWRFKQVSTITEANIKNITFENIKSTANKEFFNCNGVENDFARNTYPGTFGNAEAANITIDNIKWEPDSIAFPTPLLLMQNNLTSFKLCNSTIALNNSTFLARLTTSKAGLQAALGKFIIENCQINLGADAKLIQTDAGMVFAGEDLILRSSEVKTSNTDIGSIITLRETATFKRISIYESDLHNIPNLIFSNDNAETQVRLYGGSFINPDFIIYSTQDNSLVEYASFGTYYDEPSSALFRSLGSGVIKASGYGNRGDVPFSKLYFGDGVDLLNFDLPEGAINYRAAITAPGTTAAQTINKIVGRVNIEAGAASKVVTNSLVTSDSIVLATCATNDTTAIVKNVIASAGSFTINLDSNATAETAINFFVLN